MAKDEYGDAYESNLAEVEHDDLPAWRLSWAEVKLLFIASSVSPPASSSLPSAENS
jgi:hypothetical protein